MIRNLGAWRKSLQWRQLLVVACVLVILAIVGSNAVVLLRLRASALDDVSSNLARQSVALAAQANLSLQSVALVVNSTVEHFPLDAIENQDEFRSRLGGRDVHLALVEKTVGLPQIQALGLIDFAGNLINASRFWPIPAINVADRDHFMALKDTTAREPFVSAPFQNRVTGIWTIALGRRLHGANGKLIGFVSGSVNLKFFEDHWRSVISAGDVDSSISLNRLDGTVLARFPTTNALGRRFEDGIQNQLRDTNAVVLRKASPIDGTMHIESANVLADFPLFVLVTQTEKYALQGWRRTAQMVTLISAALVVVVLVATFGLWRWWREHEQRLLVQSEKLEAENAKVVAEAESRRGDESRLQAARLHAAIENMSQGLLMLDGEERVVVVNSPYTRMYDLSPDIIKPGCSLMDLLRHRVERGHLDADPEQFRRELMERLSGGTLITHLMQTAKGREISVVSRAIPGGGWVTTHEDITEDKAAEQLLTQTQRFLDTVIANVPAPIAVRDAVSGCITLINRAYEQFVGKSRDDLIGKTVHDLYAAEDADAVVSHDRVALQSVDRVIKTELSLQTHHGLRTIIATRLVVPDHDDRPQHLIVVIEDITERKATQEQLQQSRKMDAIGQLTGGVAHDFNNILTVITGTIEVLAQGVVDRHQLAAIAKMIDDAATRGANLTQQLLAFSRKQPLQPRDIDVNALIIDTVKLLRPTLGDHIEIEAMMDDAPWRALADPSQLSTVLLNLAINARDAMPEGGKLTFESGNVMLDDAYAATNPDIQPGVYVLIAVSDTGAGIPAAIRDRIFEPFFTTKETGKGTGLGLAMVYGFVKQSLGHIKVYSEEGHGTTIKVYLPRSDERSPLLPTAPNDEALPGGRETVLVVEDDDLVRNYVLTQLRSLGYTTLEAGNAAAALALVDAGAEFDLLFTDVIMPGGMNGRQLADEVKKRRPSIKVLYTSGYTENAIVHHGRLDAGVTLLAKPYRKGDLARMVREVLASR